MPLLRAQPHLVSPELSGSILPVPTPWDTGRDTATLPWLEAVTLSQYLLPLYSPAVPRSWTGNTAGAPSRPSRRPSPSGTTEFSGFRHRRTPADLRAALQGPSSPIPTAGPGPGSSFPSSHALVPVPAPVQVLSVPFPSLTPFPTPPSRVLRSSCPVLPAVPRAAAAPVPCEPPGPDPDPVPPLRPRRVTALPGPKQSRPQQSPGQYGRPRVPPRAPSVHP